MKQIVSTRQAPLRSGQSVRQLTANIFLLLKFLVVPANEQFISGWKNCFPEYKLTKI